MKFNFNIELLPGAVFFLKNLDDNTREKIYYNLRRSQYIYSPGFRTLTVWKHRPAIHR